MYHCDPSLFLALEVDKGASVETNNWLHSKVQVTRDIQDPVQNVKFAKLREKLVFEMKES